MGIRTHKGTFYGAFITSDNYLNSGIVPSDWECIEPTGPDKSEPIPGFERIDIVQTGNFIISETRIFLGMKMDEKSAKDLENEVKKAEKQLNIIFGKIIPLKKDSEYRIESLEMVR